LTLGAEFERSREKKKTNSAPTTPQDFFFAECFGEDLGVVEPLDGSIVCPECRSREVIRKGQRIRRVRLWIGFHPVYLQSGAALPMQ